MIYITAQPDRVKFYWQLKVQLANFQEMGINMNDVHVLVGCDLAGEPSELMQSLVNTGAQFFFYPYAQDYRYLSSVRPHILKQHYAKFPELQREYMFYTDCDVIFNRLPDFSKMPQDGSWYISDTRSYLSANYILSASGPQTLQDMCDIVGISVDKVKAREKMSGGCHYLLTDVDAAFWEKVEQDSIALFTSFPNRWNSITEKYEGPNAEKYEALGEKVLLQIWCADMWAVLWNAWLRHKYTFIHDEMSFAWANGSILDFKKKPIFHLSGLNDAEAKNTFAPHFDKRLYEQRTPFNDDLSFVSEQSATYPYVQLVKRFHHSNALAF